MELGQSLVNSTYQTQNAVLGYRNYHELLANKDIDAVVISTPDHQHAIVAVDAVRAGKDVYLQKPASLTIAEGRYLSNAVQATGPHLADWIAAAVLETISPRLRTGTQRPHWRHKTRRDRFAG